MAQFDEFLYDLANGVRGSNAREASLSRATLEADLERIVRHALRDGTGSPGLVRWVRDALPAMTGANIAGATPERAAPVLARVLCRTLINYHRGARPPVAAAGRETVAL